MGFVDLHVHSNASDGTFSPSQVVELAKNAGLDAFALTDHDTTAGVPEALEKGRDLNIEVIPGIEVSSSFDGTEIHILGPGLLYTSQMFQFTGFPLYGYGFTIQ